jgi:hypothetical protein
MEPHQVEIFLSEKPNARQWVAFDALYGEGVGGFWGTADSYDLVMERADVAGEFPLLPTHGTKELIEYEISGNGRLAA